VTPVLLVAHGSADPRAAATTRALAREVAAARPGLDVRVAFLDHGGPRPGEVLFAFQSFGYRAVVVIPLLLTAAYHGTVDLPAVIAAARRDGLVLDVAIGAVLGPVRNVVPDALLAGLVRRLAESPGARERDAVVLAAAGTRDATARAGVDLVCAELGATLGVPCMVAYASAAAPTGAEAVMALRAAGAERIVVAAYFLACGRLYDTVTSSALSGCVGAVARPLGSAREIAGLVLERVADVDHLR
jgi:sirohydrochlorin ferrochelatase